MAKWKPELGERYLYPCIHGCKVSYDFDTWQNRQIDKERYKAGVVCKDRESILALAVKMLAVANDIPLTAYRHVYDNGRIECPKCSREFIWGYYDGEGYDEIYHCPYCGQRINVVDTEE